MKLELRAITNSHRDRDRPVMMSSAMPSAKYSCSGSPLMLANGSTAIDGLSGSGRASAAAVGAGAAAVAPADAIDPHRPSDVLECSPKSSKAMSRRPPHARGPRRDADPAWLGHRFEPGGDVHAVAENVAVLDDDFADVDADAKLDASAAGNPVVASAIRAAPRGASDRIDDAGELDQEAVAGKLDDPAMAGGNRRVHDVRPDRPEAGENSVPRRYRSGENTQATSAKRTAARRRCVGIARGRLSSVGERDGQEAERASRGVR